MSNKSILQRANAAVSQSDNEGFLSECHDDLIWNFVGDQILRGKEAVREYMQENYKTPPKFTVTHLIEEGNFVTAIGSIMTKDMEGFENQHSYCDVWRFQDGKMIELLAFVIKSKE